MPSRPFRFGVQISRAVDAAEWRETARRVEGLGFSTLVSPDHFGDQFAWAPALTMAAAVTTTLRLCPYVLANDFRHPAVVAREAATLDVLSGGRLEFGLGAGWLGRDYEKSGIPMDPPGVRVDRFQEGVRVVKALFGDDPVTFAGEHYTITDLEGQPKPVQRPHPPIVLGGGGKRTLVRRAEADVVSIIPKAKPDGSGLDTTDGSAEATDRKLGWIREAAGDRWDGIEINTLLQFLTVTDSRSEADNAREELAEQLGVEPDSLRDSPFTLIGSVEEIVEALHARRERWDLSYIVIFERHMDAFAPILAKLV